MPHVLRAQVMVVGSRGMGAVQRHLMSMVGLGSVSQFLSHHVDCALAVVRDGLDVGRDLARASENVAFHVRACSAGPAHRGPVCCSELARAALTRLS